MGRAETNFDRDLEALLSEGAEGAKQREAAASETLGDVNAEGIVLFGAGNLGRRTLSVLRQVGIQPLCFVDNNDSLWGKSLEGIPVLSPAEGAMRYGNRAMFVVTIWRGEGSERMAERVRQMHQLGCKTVVPFLPLYWKYSSSLLPHYLHDLPHHVHPQADRVRKALSLMSDDASRHEFIAQMRFRLLGDFDSLPAPVQGDIYFRDDLFRLRADEMLIDCGAFDGDTLDMFLEKTAHSFTGAIAFEPDPANYAKLAARVGSLPSKTRERIAIHQAATGEKNARVLMDAGKGVSSTIGNGDCEVECIALDSLPDVPVSFIKMDIEGSELDTLAGARELIRRNTPILAVCAYHRQSDLWNIPLFIHSLNPDYSFYLRPHLLEGWDLVCYAVPSNRRSL
ncbi:MAG: FkbM family methyltransferase [Candidatus Sulfotelmatobacter sp.]